MLIIFLSLRASFLHAQKNHHTDSTSYHLCFFPKNSVMMGLAMPYATGLNTIGINSRVYYNLTKAICFGPEFSYFKDTGRSLSEINLVIHYIFETKWAGIYPVAGVNYSSEKELEVQDAVGLLWGAGIHRNFNRLTLFAEFSSVEGKPNDQFLTSGFLFTIR